MLVGELALRRCLAVILHYNPAIFVMRTVTGEEKSSYTKLTRIALFSLPMVRAGTETRPYDLG